MQKELTYDRVEPCVDCAGSGAAPGSGTERCSACNGRGRVRYQQGVFPIAIERPCSRCRGTGRIVIDPCKTCRGAGIVAKPRTIEITIPPGIENGATRLVERGGNATRGDRPPGDLELTIRVAPHHFFRRVGDDVVCSLPISVRASGARRGDRDPDPRGQGQDAHPSGHPARQPCSASRTRAFRGASWETEAISSSR